MPQAQVQIHSLDGRFIARVDFLWPELGIVGEAAGRVKYGGLPGQSTKLSRDPLWFEKRREDDLRQGGLEVIRWGTVDLGSFSRVFRAFDEAALRAREHRPALKFTLAPALIVPWRAEADEG